MSIYLPYLLKAFLMGCGIGVFYFGGLWWTVQRLPSSRHPGFLTTASFIARTAFSVFAFYLVMGTHWTRLLVSVLGFVIVRSILVRRLRPVLNIARVSKLEAISNDQNSK